MAAMNRVFLVGNVTRDPEVRKVGSGTSVLDLGLAVTERYRDKSGKQAEEVCFVDVVVWGKQAEACGQYLHKGSPALIEGRLQFDQWETDKGEKRSRLRVRAERVQFLERRAEGAAAEVETAGEEPPARSSTPRRSGGQPF
jgi:single-strand DNA-binding protein